VIDLQPHPHSQQLNHFVSLIGDAQCSSDALLGARDFWSLCVMYSERQKDWYCILGMGRGLGLPLSGMLAEVTRDSF